MTDEKVRSKFVDSKFGNANVKELSCKGMSRVEWLSTRNSLLSVGGSDLGIILGVNDYKDIVRLYFEMIDPTSRFVFKNDKDNIFAFWGRMFEETIANTWQYWEDGDDQMMLNQAKGYKPRGWVDRSSMIYNPDYPHIVANVDGEIVKHPSRSGSGILEIKTISGYAYDKWNSIPPYYYLQPQGYMVATQSDYTEIASLRDGRHLEVYLFDADPDVQDRIINDSYDFIERVRFGREMMKDRRLTKEKFFQYAQEWAPEPNGLDYLEFVKENNNLRGDDLVSVLADEELETLAIKYLESKKDLKRGKSDLAKIESLIKERFIKDKIHKATSDLVYMSWNRKLVIKYQK